MAATRTAKGTAQSKLLSSLTVSSVSLQQGASIIVCVANYELVGTADTVTWNGQALSAIASDSDGNSGVSIWVLHNVTAGTGDVVANFSDILPAAITVTEYLGLAPSPNDKIATATGSGTTPSSGATSTTAQAKELLVGAVVTTGPSGDTAGSWDSPLSAGQRVGTTGGLAHTNVTVSEGYGSVASTGTYTASKTGITSRAWCAAIATFKLVDDAAATIGPATAAGGAPASAESAGTASGTAGVASASVAAPAAAFAESPQVEIGASAEAGAPAVLRGYEQVAFAGDQAVPSIEPEDPIPNPVTGFTPSIPETAQRRSATGVFGKGQAYFALAQERSLETAMVGGGGGFEMRLTASFYEMPEVLSDVDEVHEMFSLHETGAGGLDLISIGVTPSGRVAVLTNGNAVALSAPGRIVADREAHEIAVRYSTLDALRLVYLDGALILRSEGPNVYDPATESIYFRNSVQVTWFSTGLWPREGRNSRFMLFNGRQGTTKVRAAIHRAYFAAESAELVWNLEDCSTGEMAGVVTQPYPAGSELLLGDFTLVPIRYSPETPSWPLDSSPISGAYTCLSRGFYRKATIARPDYRRAAVEESA